MKHRILLFVSLALCSAPLIGGCAVGNTYRFASVVADVKASGTVAVAVATQDRREAVTTGEKTPDFVGLQRGGYGNPFNVTTESMLPLAEAASEAICASLRQKGFQATPVKVASSATPEQIRSQVLAAKPKIGFMVYIVGWQTDTYTNVGLKYDLQLYVVDGAGNPVAESKVSGEENLGGSFMNPPKHARKAVPKAFQEVLEEMINNDAVLAALSAG